MVASDFLNTLIKDDDIYFICYAEDLCALFDYVNAGNTCEYLTFKLGDDIDLSSVDKFIPIGNKDNPFKGIFDGDGHIISDLSISGTDYVGLFGLNEGTIKNVKLIDVAISGKEKVGGLVGTNDSKGSISNCTASGNVSGKEKVSKLVGGNKRKVNDCSSTVTFIKHDETI